MVTLCETTSCFYWEPTGVTVQQRAWLTSFPCEVGWDFLQHYPPCKCLRPTLSFVTHLLSPRPQVQLSVPIKKNNWYINASLRYYWIRWVPPLGISALIKQPQTLKWLNISEKRSPMIGFLDRFSAPGQSCGWRREWGRLNHLSSCLSSPLAREQLLSRQSFFFVPSVSTFYPLCSH